MIVLSTEQCVVALSVCFFLLGVICDRLAIWFYNKYAIPDEEDEYEEDSEYQEAI